MGESCIVMRDIEGNELPQLSTRPVLCKAPYATPPNTREIRGSRNGYQGPGNIACMGENRARGQWLCSLSYRVPTGTDRGFLQVL